MSLVLRNPRVLIILLAGVCCASPTLGASSSTLAEYIAHLRAMQRVLDDCGAQPAACDAAKVGGDEQVSLPGLAAGANINFFEAHYDWLRTTLQQAHDPAMKNRDEMLSTAMNRLREALAEAQSAGSASGPAHSGFAKARARADSILGGEEFLTVENHSLWERVLARIYEWLDGLFGNVARFGKRSPWIGPFLEWGLIFLTFTGLLVWTMRVLQRQRLKVKTESSRLIEPWEEASRNWRAQASEQADRHNWREAVHCLYWASIVMLEGRRLWIPSRSRTPREYVRLLEAGSPRWSLLRQQTQSFERIWYGLDAADPADYQSALALHEQLRSA